MGENGRRRGEAPRRAEPRAREGRSGQGRRPEAARRHHRQDGRRFRRTSTSLGAEQARLTKRLDVIAPSALKDYFRNAPLARLPGADDQGAADHPAQRRRRCEFHARGEDGPLPDLPPGDRQEGLREVSAAVHDASRSWNNSWAARHRIRSTASAARCATRAWASRSASATRRTRRRTKKSKAKWEEEYHWEQPHLWDYPMLPTNMTEASCAKCHKQQVYLPNADALNIAYATYERAGCYACHKTKGFDTNMRKPGPILTKINAKLTQDWVKNWIRNPRAVKPTTWMPRFWYNSNNSDAAGRRPQRNRDQRDRGLPVRERRPRTSRRSRTRRTATRRTARRSSRASAARAATSSARAIARS